MADSEEAQFKQAFMKRVAEARIARGWKQWELAERLGMEQDKYKQYETRSLLPHHLIPQFCLACRVDMDWLLTGLGRKPIKALEVVTGEPRPVTKPKRAKTRRTA